MTCETFYALSTVSGKSGVAVIRLNGPDSARAILDMGYSKELKPRMAVYHPLRSPFDGSILDEAIFIYFKAPHSFTGDDILELHLHGSRAVIQDVIGVLSQLPYLRIAEPGEFSKKAFMNGKMDLTQAEGLAELIDAETSVQRKVALRQMGGEVASLYEQWRQQIIAILATIEALIDFPDDDIPQSMLAMVQYQITNLTAAIEKHIDDKNNLSALAHGIRIVISGPPNAGKSSLMNYLARSEVAIVSDIAGTTRDVISVKLDLAGFPLILTDTAGIREGSQDIIEQKGIVKAKSAAYDANINVVVLAANEDNSAFINNNALLFTEQTIVLFNKTDSLSAQQTKDLDDNISALKNNALRHCSTILKTSIHNQHGINQLMKALQEMVVEKYTPSDEPILTKARYREALVNCLQHLYKVDPYSAFLDITAEELRVAVMSIGTITGRVQLEEVLDQIFSSFCIGK